MSFILNPYRHAVAAAGNASRSFDGNDYIDISSSTPDAAPLSLAAWVKFSSTTGNQTVIAIEGGSSPNVNGFVLVSVSGTFWAATAAGASFDYATTTTSFSTNTWYHICAVFAATNDRKIYVNGNATPEGTNTTNLIPDTQYVELTRIGDRANETNEGTQYFNGKIADVRIYDKALSTSEISDIYNFTNVSDSLVGWWLTNNDDVLDYAGNNDGTNNGSTYSTDGPAD